VTRRALVALSLGLFSAIADEPASAQQSGACQRRDVGCLRNVYAAECARPESTTDTCLVFLQRLETARRGSYSSGVALLLGETLRDLARKDDVAPQARERYLARAVAAYREVVKNEPLSASGYLGLAELAEAGEARVGWLRRAVQAELQPAHMELLANTLSAEIGGHEGDLEAALTLEDAYTLESTATERWRYGASAWQKYTEAVERYPVAASESSLEHVLIRIKDEIDYPLLQRTLLAPESYLAYLADAFAIMCERSIVAIVGIDECMQGLELAVATAERSASSGTRRWLAEAVLTGMRTIAGESLPRSFEQQIKFPDWIDRLLATGLSPVDVAADLLEARADYTADLLERADALLSAIELSRNRGDLRLKLGATYVTLRLWPEALEQLSVARYLLPAEEHERVDRLVATADKAYQARFLPPDATPPDAIPAEAVAPQSVAPQARE
jgi:hypothetical protein